MQHQDRNEPPLRDPITFPCYAKAFLGVVGPSRRVDEARFPEPLRAMGLHCLTTSTFDLYWLGSSAATLDPAPGPATSVWIKGRPFYLSPSPTLSAWHNAHRALPRVLRNLDGKFSLLLAPPSGPLVCATDLIASGSIYYCEQDEHVYISTHLGLLLSAIPRIPDHDPLGLVSLLATRLSITGATPWQGVHRLPAGGFLTIQPRPGRGPAWTASSYAEPGEAIGVAPVPTSRSADSLVEEYDALLEQSLRRERYKGSVALMLSGGRDSPALALSLVKGAITDFEAVSFGSAGSRDLVGATRVATQLRLPHRVVPYEDWHFGTYAERIAALNGGASGVQIAFMCAGFEFAGGQFKTAIVGHLGNRLAADGLVIPLTFGERMEQLRNYWGAPDRTVERFYPDEYNEILEFLRQRYDQPRRNLVPFPALHARSLPLSSSWISVHFDVCETYLELSYPFFYRPFLTFVVGLQSSLLASGELYSRWRASAESQAQAVVARRAPPRPADGRPPRDPSHPPEEATHPSAPDLFDWSERVCRSARSMLELLDRCGEDGRLKDACLYSLRQSLAGNGHPIPMALLALAPALAKTLLSRANPGTPSATYHQYQWS